MRLDGYKGHVAIDPDSEVITAAEVVAANAGDAAMAQALLDDLPRAPGGQTTSAAEAELADQATAEQAPADHTPVVYGDAAYGTGALLAESVVVSGVSATPPRVPVMVS